MTNPPNNPRILIVEDDLEIVQDLTNFLGSEGFETAVAVDNETARAEILRSRVDLALLDPDTPGCEGFALLHALQAGEAERQGIIISRTGSSEKVRAAMIHGAFDFYTRPFDYSQLRASIADALAGCSITGKGQEVSRV